MEGHIINKEERSWEGRSSPPPPVRRLFGFRSAFAAANIPNASLVSFIFNERGDTDTEEGLGFLVCVRGVWGGGSALGGGEGGHWGETLKPVDCRRIPPVPTPTLLAGLPTTHTSLSLPGRIGSLPLFVCFAFVKSSARRRKENTRRAVREAVARTLLLKSCCLNSQHLRPGKQASSLCFLRYPPYVQRPLLHLSLVSTIPFAS